MDFIEIIVQGIGPFPKPFKLVFGPGYNLILGGNETGKTLIYQLMTAVIDPDRFTAVQAQVPIAEGGEVAPRAGIRFRGQDREYRVVRDFKTGDLVINQLDPDTQEWKVVDRNPETWKKLWRKEAGISAADYVSLFTLNRFEFTRAPEAKPVRTAGKKPIAAAPAAPKETGGQEEKINALKKELARAEEIERIEFELDGLHTQLFQIEEKGKGVSGIEDKIKEVAVKARKCPGYEDLPSDLEAKLEAFKKLNSQKGEELGKLEEEKKQVDTEFTVLSGLRDFYREPLFIAGAAVAFLALISAIAFSRWIPTWSTAPFLFGGAGACFYNLWKFWSRKERAAKIKEQLNTWDEKIRMMEKRFEIEGSFVRRLLEKTGVSSPGDLLERWKEYRGLGEEKKRLEQEKADYLAKFDLSEMESQRARLKAEIDKRQGQLLETGGVAMDPMEMRREIKRLEAQMGQGDPGAGIETVEGLGSFSEEQEPPPWAGEELETREAGPWERIREILKVNEDELRKKIIEGSSQTLGILTQGRYQLLPDPRGEYGFQVVSASSQQSLAARGLCPSTRETAAASWQLTIWKALCSRFSLPIILDDPFRNFDQSRLAVLVQTLKRISTRAQIIHFSFNPALTKIADQTVPLGK